MKEKYEVVGLVKRSLEAAASSGELPAGWTVSATGRLVVSLEFYDEAAGRQRVIEVRVSELNI